jgi:hypothetical protein
LVAHKCKNSVIGVARRILRQNLIDFVNELETAD